MPVAHSELAILNAEQFDDGISSRGTRRTLRSSSSEDAPSTPRKRVRAQESTPTSNDGEEKKRSRGRPRLNANDESAAERRRTQIRLAQRAYRNRKENAITTLEQQVKDLRDTNEEMSNAFMALHDFAVRQGLLDNIPDFGVHLRSTTEKFLALARKSSESSTDGDADGAPTSQGGNEGAGSGGRKNSQGRQAGRTSSSPETVEVTKLATAPPTLDAPPSQQLYGGFLVTHDASTDSGSAASLPNSFPPLLDFGGLMANNVSGTNATTASSEFEIITQPSFENASFPFTFTDSQLQSILDNSGSSIDNTTPHIPSPYSTRLTPPRTYSAVESTFGRRLQRFALERALALISLPNPPPLRLVRVFGFCLPFESADAIRKRLQTTLERSRYESLNHWASPFHNLGGTGTHFPPSSAGGGDGVDDLYYGRRLLGNEGTVDIARNGHVSGFSTGPFSRAVTEARDSHLDKRQRITVPGFEGDFYDPDEVEMYMRRSGVEIAPAQDFVTAEVDLSIFEDKSVRDDSVQQSQQQQQRQQKYPSAGAGMFPGPSFMGLTPGDRGAGDYLPPAEKVTGPSTLPISPLPTSQAGSSAVDAFWSAGILGNNVGGPGDLSSYMLGAGPFTTTPGSFGAAATTADFGLSFSAEMAFQQAGRSRKTLVTLDVNLFVQKLTDKATCLGRSPGFRIDNVREAFLASAHRLSI